MSARVAENLRSGIDRIRGSLKRVGPLIALYGVLHGWWYRADKRVRSVRRGLFDRRVLARYVDAQPVRSLQLGAGPNPLPGWLNTDLSPDLYPELREQLVFLDASKPFPLPAMTFDFVFSEHQIEHLPEPDAVRMVHEVFRVLRPGGRIRIATPDFAAVVGLHKDELTEVERRYVDWVMTSFWPHVQSGNPRCYVINKMFTGHGHRFIYDQETLSAMLADAGFVEIIRCLPGESATPALRGLEAHGRALAADEVNRFETMVLEGMRPPA